MTCQKASRFYVYLLIDLGGLGLRGNPTWFPAAYLGTTGLAGLEWKMRSKWMRNSALGVYREVLQKFTKADLCSCPQQKAEATIRLLPP